MQTKPSSPFPTGEFHPSITIQNANSSYVKLKVGDRTYRVWVDTDSFDSCYELVFSLQITIPELEAIGWTVSSKRGFCMTSVMTEGKVYSLITMVTMDEEGKEFSRFNAEWLDDGEILIPSPELGLKDDQWPTPSLVAEYLAEKLGMAAFNMRHDHLADKYNMSQEDRGRLALMLGIKPKIDIKYKEPKTDPNVVTISDSKGGVRC